MADLIRHLQHAARSLIRDRHAMAAAVLCLAIGIGANVAMLRALDFLLFQPPAYVVDASNVHRIYLSRTLAGLGELTSSLTSYPNFHDLNANPGKLKSLAAYCRFETYLGRGEGVRKVRAEAVSASFFSLLGIRPVLGRLFSPAESEAERPSSAAIISYELWLRAFQGMDVLGKPIAIGSDTYTVIGVLPPRFTGVDLQTVEIWLPINAVAARMGNSWYDQRGSSFLEVVGRLGSAVDLALAQQQATAALRRAYKEAGRPDPSLQVSLGPLQRAWGPGVPKNARISLWLAAVSLLVLLIACANVIGLLTVRGHERRNELAMRTVLGAGRWRLARMLLLESILLVIAGGVGALAVMAAAGPLIRVCLFPEGTTPGGPIDLRTLGIFVSVIVAAVLLCGILPTLLGTRELGATARGSRASQPAGSGWRTGLLVGQVALTLLLLASAGLFVSSLQRARGLDLGFDTECVAVATIDLERTGHSPLQAEAIYSQARERVRHLPAVERVSLAATIPFSTSVVLPLAVPSRQDLPVLATGGAYINAVDEDFFRTLGVPLLAGRSFTAADRRGTAPVAIVNLTMARLLWGRNPIGQCIKIGGASSACSTVIGVVGDTRRMELREGLTLQYYVPLEQAPPSVSSRALFIRSPVQSATVVQEVRQALQAISPDTAPVEAQHLSDLLDPQLQPWKTGAILLSLYGSLALALSAIGVYGLIAHTVAQRRNEMGIRMALGAPPQQITWEVLRRGMAVMACGVACGLLLTLLAGRAMASLLFEVAPSDPGVLAVATLVLIIAALTASYLPMRRAQRTDPGELLRIE